MVNIGNVPLQIFENAQAGEKWVCKFSVSTFMSLTPTQEGSTDSRLELQGWETHKILNFALMCFDIHSFTREKRGMKFSSLKM